jgi:ribosomal protein S18 acetylase RimI-like enzyme
MPVTKADEKDIPALVALLNSAYRGAASKKGWTTEADMISGEIRTDPQTLEKLMQTPGIVFLKLTRSDNEINGCVFLQIKENKLYLGMLSVSPLLQAKGLGKQLMYAADEYAKANNCTAIFMRVISLRHELIAWHERQGFIKTGETEPFPADDRFGIPAKPLEFLIMEKKI